MYKFTPIRYVQCDKCKNKEGPKGQPGFYFVTNGNSKGVVECECHKEWVKKNSIYIHAYKNNIWVDPDSLDYSLDKYVGKNIGTIKTIRKYLERYDLESTRKMCLYLQGEGYTQKTTVAQHIGLSIFRLGYSAFYFQMKALNDLFKSPFSLNVEEANENKFILDRIEQSDCLIIDDAFDKNIAPVYSTGSQSPYIESFLRERIDNKKKGVIFVSRVLPKDIKKNGYSDSLQSFVEMNTIAKHTLFHFQDVFSDFDEDEIFKD